MKRPLTRRGISIVALLAGLLFCPTSLYAASDSGVWDTDADTFRVTEQGETIKQGTVTLAAGSSRDLNSYIIHGVTNDDAYEQWHLTDSIRWSSSNPDVASVNSAGVVTANKVGTAVVTATGHDNMSRTQIQSITVGITGVDNSTRTTGQNSFTISEGNWLDLGALSLPGGSGAAKAVWSSGNETVATVDSNGLVQSKGVGHCIITVEFTSGEGDTVTHKIHLRVTALYLSEKVKESSIILCAGQAVDIAALLYPNYTGLTRALNDIAVSSGNSDVAAVSGKRVSPKSGGTSTVTVTQQEGNGTRTTHKVTVTVVL